MRVHITVDDDVIHELDTRIGARQRSRFIVGALLRALDDERRWDEITSALASIADEGHGWDEDPAAWVHQQRRGDLRRVG